MRRKLRPYPNLIKRELIRQYLQAHTGILVSPHRIGRWIAAGEIRVIKVPRRCGGGQWVDKRVLDQLIERYS